MSPSLVAPKAQELQAFTLSMLLCGSSGDPGTGLGEFQDFLWFFCPLLAEQQDLLQQSWGVHSSCTILALSEESGLWWDGQEWSCGSGVLAGGLCWGSAAGREHLHRVIGLSGVQK